MNNPKEDLELIAGLASMVSSSMKDIAQTADPADRNRLLQKNIDPRSVVMSAKNELIKNVANPAPLKPVPTHVIETIEETPVQENGPVQLELPLVIPAELPPVQRALNQLHEDNLVMIDLLKQIVENTRKKRISGPL